MFFSYASRIPSILGLVLGIMLVLIGVMIAKDWTGLPYDTALARYAPGSSSSGQVIDKGIYCIVFALALGTLAEISFAVRKKHN